MKTALTEMLNCKWPIIGAPMFIVGTVDMVAAISNSGGVGTIPTLNFRSTALLGEGLGKIRSKTSHTFGVNLIVHKTNKRWEADLEVCAAHQVPFFITSLGSPSAVIEKVKPYGAKVFCDVTNIKHAKKALDGGADGLIAVCAGAGGHAGPHSPFALVSELQQITDKPIVVAGAVASGKTILSSLALGAAGVSIGTRFIATTEANATPEYKQAIVKAKIEHIQKSTKMTGIPASVIRTPQIEAMFNPPTLLEKLVYIIEKKNQGKTNLSKKIRKFAGLNWSWNNVWSAGESVTQVHDIKTSAEVMKDLVQEMQTSLQDLNSRF